MEKKRVLLIDDHRLFTNALSNILESNGYDVVGTAIKANEGIILAHQERPDLILMDIKIEPFDGIEATKQIKRSHPEIKILMVTMFEKANYLKMARNAGAEGYFFKAYHQDELILAIETVLQGKTYFPEKRLDQGLNFTRKEIEVLQLMERGHSTPDISEAMGITENTVKFHRKAIKRKTGEKTSAGQIRIAKEHGEF